MGEFLHRLPAYPNTDSIQDEGVCFVKESESALSVWLFASTAVWVAHTAAGTR